MNKIDSKLRFKSGIYMFFNIVSGKRYIGSSVDIYIIEYMSIYII